MPFKIAIIGAGPAGCMLGRLLHLANIEATIFEAEASCNFRNQGGSLDLSKKSGIAAIKAAGLFDEYLKFCRFDGSALGVCNKKAHFYFQIGASKHGNPEIDRSELRSLLANSLPEGMIRWNHRLRRVDENGELHFDNSTETGYDLIVGAEGAWSKVRSFLSEEEPFFSEIAGYNLSIPNAAENAPDVSKMVNRGSVFAYSNGKAIIGQQMADASIHVSVWLRQDNDPFPLGTRTMPPTKEEISKSFDDWSPELLRFIQAAVGEITCRTNYMLPVGFKWQHQKGVTMVGDAAHLMTPFAGVGVNIALEDTMKLAAAIIDAAKDGKKGALDARIKDFETDMFVRAEKAERLTDGMMRDAFFTGGEPRIASWLLRRIAYETPPLLRPILYPLEAGVVYIALFWRNLWR